MSLSREVEARLKMKCDMLLEAFILDDSGKCELRITDLMWGCDGELMISTVYHFVFICLLISSFLIQTLHLEVKVQVLGFRKGLCSFM